MSSQTARRDDLQAVDDPQVRETRKRLVEAFQFAVARELPTVSVTWICTHSGVARSTFYTHFATVDDLAIFTIVEAFAAVSDADVERRRAHTEDRESITRIGLHQEIDVLLASRGTILYAARIGSRAELVDRLAAEATRLVRRTIAAELEHLSESSIDLMAEFVGAGTTHLLFLWLERGAVSRDELVDEIVEMLPRALTRDR